MDSSRYSWTDYFYHIRRKRKIGWMLQFSLIAADFGQTAASAKSVTYLVAPLVSVTIKLETFTGSKSASVRLVRQERSLSFQHASGVPINPPPLPSSCNQPEASPAKSQIPPELRLLRSVCSFPCRTIASPAVPF